VVLSIASLKREWVRFEQKVGILFKRPFMQVTLEDDFTDLLGGFMRRWAFVRAMMVSIQHGLYGASQSLSETYSDVIPEFFARYRLLPELTPETFETSGIGEQISSTLVNMTITQALAGAEAASLIFAHTILDDLATSILDFLAAAAPDQWEEEVKDKKIALKDIKGRSFSDLQEQLLRDYVIQLSEDKSLPKRIGLVFKKAKASRKLINEFSYDESRMEQLDALRHSFIHKDALGRRIPSIDVDLQFMYRSGMAMLVAVSQHFSIQANPLRMMQAVPELNKSYTP
jgi:hypothetical protein